MRDELYTHLPIEKRKKKTRRQSLVDYCNGRPIGQSRPLPGRGLLLLLLVLLSVGSVLVSSSCVMASRFNLSELCPDLVEIDARNRPPRPSTSPPICKFIPITFPLNVHPHSRSPNVHPLSLPSNVHPHHFPLKVHLQRDR